MANKDSSSELIRGKDLGVFDRWSLPSFDPESPVVVEAEQSAEVDEAEQFAAAEPLGQVEDVELEAVKPLTLDELEAIRQDAYNEGFATGEKDGFHAGQIKARQEAEVTLCAQVERLERVMGQLLDPIAEQDRQIEESLVHLVSLITREVIQRELHTDSSQLRHVLREALKLLPMGAGNVRIHVNPQDFDLVKAMRDRHEETWRILEDEALQPGGCRVETEHSRIDASVETRLSQALKQLFERQREHKVHPPAADRSLEVGALEMAVHAD
ncbi:flagellar assembly protein FliH [Pseudomonas boanensis]|uniref:flagellar assembly protein FliH n=1 Tax=Metapseudomonas boanensis TaxID=2822138 RepID=UPI0035D48670